MSFVQAATLPVAAMTAFHALEAAGYRPGETVLVNGAGSGVSLAVLALAAAAGCGASNDESQVVTITPAQVREHFKQATGRALRPAAVPDPAWEQLGFGLDQPERLVGAHRAPGIRRARGDDQEPRVLRAEGAPRRA